jgi:hypothetical protein
VIEELKRLRATAQELLERVVRDPDGTDHSEAIIGWSDAVKEAVGPENRFWCNPLDFPVKDHKSASRQDYEELLMKRNLLTINNILEHLA